MVTKQEQRELKRFGFVREMQGVKSAGYWTHQVTGAQLWLELYEYPPTRQWRATVDVDELTFEVAADTIELALLLLSQRMRQRVNEIRKTLSTLNASLIGASSESGKPRSASRQSRSHPKVRRAPR